MDFRNNEAASGSKGLRNNNPGNFRTGIKWQGVVGDDGTGFLVFSDITYGLRAMALNLYNDYYIDGITTISGYINKYAPPSENNSTAYAATVADWVGIGVNDDMDLDAATTEDIIRGQMNVELGEEYSGMVSDADVAQGVAMIGKFEIDALKTIGAVVQNPVKSLIIAGVIAAGIGLYVYEIYKNRKKI